MVSRKRAICKAELSPTERDLSYVYVSRTPTENRFLARRFTLIHQLLTFPPRGYRHVFNDRTLTDYYYHVYLPGMLDKYTIYKYTDTSCETPA